MCLLGCSLCAVKRNKQGESLARVFPTGPCAGLGTRSALPRWIILSNQDRLTPTAKKPHSCLQRFFIPARQELCLELQDPVKTKASLSLPAPAPAWQESAGWPGRPVSSPRGARGGNDSAPSGSKGAAFGCPLVRQGPRPHAIDPLAQPGWSWRLELLPPLLCVAVKRLSINRVWIVEQSARFVCSVVRGSKVGIVLLRTIPSSFSLRNTGCRGGGRHVSVLTLGTFICFPE